MTTTLCTDLWIFQKSVNNMLQIQPVYNKKNDYNALSESKGLFFEAIELSFDNVSPEKFQWYKNCQKVKSYHGVFMDVNPASGDSLIAELSKKRYIESCEKALECSVENVIFHSTCFPFLRGTYLDVWAEKSAEFYTYLAEKYSTLNFYVENSFDINPEPMNSLMKLITVPNVKVCLDLGHINYSQASLDEWFDVLGDKTGYLHLSDNMGVYDDHIAVGSGTTDWLKADKLCAFLSKNTPVTIEVNTIDDVISSLDYINKHNLFGGIL